MLNSHPMTLKFGMETTKKKDNHNPYHFPIMGALGIVTIARSFSQLTTKAKHPRDDQTLTQQEEAEFCSTEDATHNPDHHLYLLHLLEWKPPFLLFLIKFISFEMILVRFESCKHLTMLIWDILLMRRVVLK